MPHEPAPDRRRFLESVSTFGCAVALRGVVPGDVGAHVTARRTSTGKGVRGRRPAQKMVIATEYTVEQEVSVPVVQTAYKDYIEEISQGEIEVELHSGGELGVGGVLVEKLLSGEVHAIQVSLANMAAFVPAIDLINIPYWCGDNQRFANLITSQAWADEIAPQLAARDLKVLFYYTEDPRTIATRRGVGGPVRTPEDARGLRIRVPGSRVLAEFCRLVGAEPVPIPWGRTLEALREGEADALDPAGTTLYTAGFLDVLGSISLISSVPDANVYVCSLRWFESLTPEARTALEEASDKAMVASFTALPGCRAYSDDKLQAQGVEIYQPTEDEIAAWVEAAGEHRPEWDSFKTELAGSLDAFARLKLAASTEGKYIF
jgi:TRAP-type C4-dicarboxylate transport system substrate-binding protein